MTIIHKRLMIGLILCIAVTSFITVLVNQVSQAESTSQKNSVTADVATGATILELILH